MRHQGLPIDRRRWASLYWSLLVFVRENPPPVFLENYSAEKRWSGFSSYLHVQLNFSVNRPILWQWIGILEGKWNGNEMGQFFIPRSRVQQEYNSLLVNALNGIFKSNLPLNEPKWNGCLQNWTFRTFEILYPVLENASEMDTPF